MDNLLILNERITEAGGSTALGGEEVEGLILAGLTRLDDQGVRRPQLAEATPTLENGLWRLFPDGRMETTWRIREHARWHDGAPFSAADLVFTATALQDRELPLRWLPAYDSVESLAAPDSRTLVVQWKAPFIDADALLGESLMPRHLLERAYRENKAGFVHLPYWSQEFVGNGAFKVRELVPGSHLVLEAFPDYVLGRPKIDEITIKFVPDGNALMANVLAGAVELTLGRGFSIDQANQVRESWREGGVQMQFRSWVVTYPQMLDPSPAIVANLSFRRALIQATDRQQMVEAIQSGQVPVADAFFNPRQPEYREIESAIVRYSYDPRRAEQMLAQLGYQRGAGGMLRDAAGQRLELELRAVETDINKKGILAVADYWQRVGVAAEPFVVPRARARDPEYRATFPAFEFTRQPNDPSDLKRYHSNQARLPRNNFTGSNYSRYINPEWDALLDTFFVTISRPERMAVLRQIIHHMTDVLIPMGMFHDGQPVLVSKRVQGVTADELGWNAQAWDLASGGG